MVDNDAEWRKFSALCNDLRSVKNSKGVSSAIEKMQSYLSDDRVRQLVHRWRSWGYVLNCLLHVLKEEMRVYLDLGGAGRKRLRTELETAHVAADGPLLHLDPNGRDCICQLFTFSVAVIDRQTSIEFDRSFETLVDKEAWLTVEVLVQYKVYCAVLDYKDWKNMLDLALGSISPTLDSDLIGDTATAATRARVIRFLLKNCLFDLNENSEERELLSGVVGVIEQWFEVGKGKSIVDKEAWLTVEVLVQYKVYCAVLDYKDWKNMLDLALGSISPTLDSDLIGDTATAATRARVIRFLLKNCLFDLNENSEERELLSGVVGVIEQWFEVGKGKSMEKEADSLLLVIASTLLETLTDLMRAYFGSIGPYLLNRGVTMLEFIVKSNKARKNGLRGAPAEFLMLFFELYQHNVTAEPSFCYLTPTKLLREMKKLRENNDWAMRWVSMT
ncbi:Phosphatidylinositol kinase (PIK-5) [Phytophthora palmivora]|uniref:Phosphatidylinositol kinase (PIK-5) n=1 Tax=Phytophthora palmivora TaxID=4796 RepID=A0A2P4XF18_9STRA|nr:Phosphatidylinositol kinase (PIK-5) [Phytophthora palmivora]